MKETCARFLFLLLAVAATLGLALAPVAGGTADTLCGGGDLLARAASGGAGG